MRNKLTDLNDYLFEQLERLSDDELTDEALAKEIGRAKAVTNVAQAIINNASTVLTASKFLDESGYTQPNKSGALKMLGCTIETKNEF